MSVDVVRRNNVQLSGAGEQTMLFAHGFGCDQSMWRFVAPAFAASYRVGLFDYVGCGKSDMGAYRDERYQSLEGYALDVLEICEALDLHQVVYVGHSVSSVIGMLAALRAPERFSQLIMIGPSPCYINHPPAYMGGFERADLEGLIDLMDRNYLGWANFLAPVIMKNPDQPELAQELEQSFCSTDPHIAHNFAVATFFSDNRADLARLLVPALVLQCTEDAIAPDQVGLYMHEHLPASTFHRLAATGHCPHMSHPRETIAAMSAYLAAQGLGM